MAQLIRICAVPPEENKKSCPPNDAIPIVLSRQHQKTGKRENTPAYRVRNARHAATAKIRAQNVSKWVLNVSLACELHILVVNVANPTAEEHPLHCPD